MTKTKNTKRALVSSILSLIVCVSMLIGSTFAWFTDSVTSGNNKIVAGTLEVDLLMADENGNYDSIAGENAAIFGEGSLAQDNAQQTLWEPVFFFFSCYGQKIQSHRRSANAEQSICSTGKGGADNNCF